MDTRTGNRAAVCSTRGRRNERGSTLVEFALAAPILFMVTFLIVDLGMFFFKQHTVQFATREGVRLALVGGTVNDSNGNPLGREASIVATIQRCAKVANIQPNELSISIYPLNPDYTDPGGWQGVRNPGQPGQMMRVRTSYQYSFMTPLVKRLGPKSAFTVQAQATYQNELFE